MGSGNSQYAVVIRTNGGTLTVGTDDNVAKGQIWHYGMLDNAIVYTENTCFHTHGKIADMDLKAGKAIAEDKGYVALLKASAGTLVEEKDTGVFYIPTNATTATVDATVAATLGYTVTSEGTSADQSRTSKLNSTNYEIKDKFDLIAFRNAWNAGKLNAGIRVVLTSDIDMLGVEWTEFIGTGSNKFKGTFDGQNHKIANLSNNGIASTEILVNKTTGNQGSIFGLFGHVGGNTVIKNLEISVNAYSNEGNGWGSVVACAKEENSSLTLYNIKASGILNGIDKAGGLVGDASGKNIALSFEKCYNHVEVTGDRAAGIVCCIQNAASATFIDCHNYGNITSSKTKYGTVAGITPQDGGKATFTNCSNEGELDGHIAYGIAADVFITFDSTGNYKAVTSNILVSKLMEYFSGNHFVGEEITPVNWQWLETHTGTGDYAGLFAGVTYGLDETYEIVVNERIVSENFEYTRKFKTLDEALSHGLQNPTITMSSDQTLSYTFESGWAKGEGEVALLPTLDLSGNTLSVSKRLAKVQGIVTFKNGTINYTGTDELAHFANHGGLAFEGVTLNAGTISVEHTAANNCSLTFNENSHITCTVSLSGSETSIIINGTTYTRSNGQYIVITDNVISQVDSL